MAASAAAAAASAPFASTAATTTMDRHFPPHVGIHAMDIYFPTTYVQQSEFEVATNVSAGKYTIGLGQEAFAYVTDREDVYSMCLTAVRNFMRKFNVRYEDIGRLEVGTETVLDHSKSVKSVLMQLFAEHGNTDIEGIDSMNACYAGTNALFNSVDWIESSSFDGRYALAVAADIAEYAEGPARPTNGAGAVVMLIGPNAPLVIERGCRSSHMEHAWDFYKPNMESPYPVVDGKFSNSCYLRALDKCYQRFKSKFEKRYGAPFSHTDADHVVLHAPYNKLTQKAFARLYYNEFLSAPDRAEFASLQAFCALSVEQSYGDVALEKALVALSKTAYAEVVGPSTLLPRLCGNMYTASLYAGLLSLVHDKGTELCGKRVLLFSYGSGLAASMFAVRVRGGSAAGNGDDEDEVKAREALAQWHGRLDLTRRLEERTRSSCDEFAQWMKVREALHSRASFEPTAAAAPPVLRPGTFYLVRKNDMSQREYAMLAE